MPILCQNSPQSPCFFLCAATWFLWISLSFVHKCVLLCIQLRMAFLLQVPLSLPQLPVLYCLLHLLIMPMHKLADCHACHLLFQDCYAMVLLKFHFPLKLACIYLTLLTTISLNVFQKCFFPPSKFPALMQTVVLVSNHIHSMVMNLIKPT